MIAYTDRDSMVIAMSTSHSDTQPKISNKPKKLNKRKENAITSIDDNEVS